METTLATEGTKVTQENDVLDTKEMITCLVSLF